MKKIFNLKFTLALLLALSPALYAQKAAVKYAVKAAVKAPVVSSVTAPAVSSAAAPAVRQSTQTFRTYAIAPAPQYSDEKNWLVLPPKGQELYGVDVFYIYPTIFGGNGLQYQNFDDEAAKQNALNQINFDTAVLGSEVNVFAPYYRSASIEVVKLDDKSLENFLVIPYQDSLKAFDYYMQHYNNGRPFILMGFSQGSMMIKNIMEQKFADKKLQDKLIAAYIIGWSVTKSDLEKYPFLKPAKGPKDTGVIISYNTELPGTGYTFLLRPGAVAINPVNWRTDGAKSKKKQYEGAVIFDRVTQTTSRENPITTAWLEEGTNALVVDADASKYSASQEIFPSGVLHMYDYMFFFNNLKDNAAERIKRYQKEHK